MVPSLRYDVLNELSDGLWLAVPNGDRDLLLVFFACLVPLCGVKVLDGSRWHFEDFTESHLPVLGERGREAEDFLIFSERGQTGQSSGVQAQQVALDHVLCLVDDEDLVVPVFFPSIGVPVVGYSYSPWSLEKGKLLLNLVGHNPGGDVDDDSGCFGLVQLEAARCNQQENEGLSCCWRCDSDK